MSSRYENADWTKQDCELAREYGVSRERVRQVRNNLGKPKSPDARCSQNTIAVRRDLQRGLHQGLSALEISQIYGCSRASIATLFVKLGRDPNPPTPKRWAYWTPERIKDETIKIGECWKFPYGNINPVNGFMRLSFRYTHIETYKLLIGKIPKGCRITRTCGHPWCVNPAHLRATTQAELSCIRERIKRTNRELHNRTTCNF